jgi:hypothetical protein
MFNQEKSLVTPGYFGSNQDNIIIVENFIDKQDLKTIQDFCLKINKWVDTGENQYADDGTCIYDASYWADRQCSGEIIKSLDPNIYDLIDKYILKMKLLLENKFNVELFQRPPVIIKCLMLISSLLMDRLTHFQIMILIHYFTTMMTLKAGSYIILNLIWLLNQNLVLL